ncbi:MAG: transglutaminase-like putative cysteine protease [Chitinophagales bacterium]|jgi:transglutaminase-like putative cysteine protease
MQVYLKETEILDFSHPNIVEFVQEAITDCADDNDRAVALFYAVRDHFLYNPFYVNTAENELQVSKVIDRGFGHCIDKAGLLIACYRSVGLPSRIGLAKVKNHIATERLEEYLGSNVLAPHGYVEVFVNDNWRKVTPAFNESLCTKLGVDNLEFDGANDCLFQAYNKGGDQFMEYLEDYGHFEDIPVQFIIDIMLKTYPKLKTQGSDGITIDLRETL